VLDLGVAVITTVQLDHQAHLGTTLAAIGTEKAAIIKAGNVAVTGASGRGVRPILDRSAALGVPVLRAGGAGGYRAEVIDQGWGGIVVDVATPERRLEGLRIGLVGRHQAANATVAIAMLDAIIDRFGIEVPEPALRRGLADARWPGRMEVLDGQRVGLTRVLLDGAHNPAGAAALAGALDDLGLRRPNIVFGAMRTKDVRGVLRALAPLDPRFVFTAVDDPGAMPPDELAATWASMSGTSRTTRTAADPRAALGIADGDPVVVAGSLYLVGAVRGMITGMDGQP